MNKAALDQTWDLIRQKYGIYLRLLESLPEDQFHTHPIEGMRTVAETVAHTSGSIVRDIAVGIAEGEIRANEAGEGDVAQGLETKAAVIDFARRCWEIADAAVGETGDAQLHAIVDTPWNMQFPGFVGYGILNDEFLHHRGQLYAYARAVGVAPPFLWGFGENEEAFRPVEAGE